MGGFLNHSEYIQGLNFAHNEYNIFMMFVKSVVFGFLLTSISCYMGYFVKGGSIELGKASTSAVVYSNIFILLADLVIALLLT